MAERWRAKGPGRKSLRQVTGLPILARHGQVDRIVPAPQRLVALGVAGVAGAGIALQAVSTAEVLGIGGWALLAVLGGYFTLLTALLAAATFLWVAVTGRCAGAAWHGGLLLWCVTLAGIYHALLAGLWTPVGVGWWADKALHLALPLLVALHWLAWAPKDGLGLGAVLLWLSWPAAYAGVILVRGAAMGSYPYPFLDANALGWAGVARSLAGLSLAFLLGGLLVVGVARMLVPQSERPGASSR
jgi:hypothetical protein